MDACYLFSLRVKGDSVRFRSFATYATRRARGYGADDGGVGRAVGTRAGRRSVPGSGARLVRESYEARASRRRVGRPRERCAAGSAAGAGLGRRPARLRPPPSPPPIDVIFILD